MRTMMGIVVLALMTTNAQAAKWAGGPVPAGNVEEATSAVEDANKAVEEARVNEARLEETKKTYAEARLAAEREALVNGLDALEAKVKKDLGAIKNIREAHSILWRECTPVPDLVVGWNRQLFEIKVRVERLDKEYRNLSHRAEAFKKDRRRPDNTAHQTNAANVLRVNSDDLEACRRPAFLLDHQHTTGDLLWYTEDIRWLRGALAPEN